MKLTPDPMLNITDQLTYARNEIERLNLVAAQEENKRLNEKIEHLLQIKKLHEKVVLLQEQKASLSASLDYYERR